VEFAIENYFTINKSELFRTGDTKSMMRIKYEQRIIFEND